MEILDSGNRREFESGAARDVAEGKGRCDLLPLGCIASYFNRRIDSNNPNKDKAIIVCIILDQLDRVMRREDDDYISPIMQAVKSFV